MANIGGVELRRMGAGTARDLMTHRTLTGKHMNSQGGSWSYEKLAARAQEGDNDWAVHDNTRNALGYYWVAYKNNTPVSLAGVHRSTYNGVFTFRAYFAAGVDPGLCVAVIHCAMREFASLRPDQSMVRTRFRNGCPASSVYVDAGFRWILQDKVAKPGTRYYRHVTVFNYDLPQDAATRRA